MAISSSCGALDNIVVDTIDTAQKCVTFLKEQNIGVATFIGLDKVNMKDLNNFSQEKYNFLSLNDFSYIFCEILCLQMASISCCSFSFILTSFAQMKVWEKSMASIRTPDDSPRLFDMVRVNDDSVRPAFYFALRDTLVAQNLEQATRIAYQKDKRWRVVTLKGEIIEMAGG